MHTESNDISGMATGMDAAPTEVNNTNRYFRGQMKTEELLCFSRKHWVTIAPYLGGFALFWLMYFLYLVAFPKRIVVDFIGADGYRIALFLAATIFTYLLHRCFIHIFNYYLRTMIVTNYRIVNVDKTIFLHDSRDAIDVPEIQDIQMKKEGILQTVFNYGELIILLSSAGEPKRIRYIPNPDYHFRKINKTKREYILGRQMAKQATQERSWIGLEDIKMQIPRESIGLMPKE